ncbi:gliding motility-associated C-terminal domain-containing protein [Capnocytophaga genosp. AHN8471]|uniref:Gliding motility-associated C-terminal domain-containing protein n=2 Tax=Capnocytophaga genosp. AHN8471 TaxID=327574 RepID=A0ABS1YVQ0_9FLAO|nr:gliding motility-associated C-terminal domain-containing protein [Capnocytophaga genosp. AHN8471]MBM0650475.1 gliding motility-associated C-terminal domain-containing protein [Capnocytophaga genosp. AHN8471]
MNTLLLFFLISTVHSQNIINKLTVNTSIHIAMSKFATPLVVEVKIPKGETSVGLKVSFPEGISYSKIEIPQQEKTSVKIEKTTTSTANQPIFIITAAPESVVKILIHRNFNKQVKANVNYSDVVEAILGGKTVEKQTSEFYQLKFPKLTTAMDPIEVGSKGENRRGLTVKNLGEGYIKEFYLSIQYPDNIKNKALYYKKGLNYHLLTPETAVPKEFAKKGLYLYKINVKLLKKEEDAELSLAQEYEIDNCFSPTPIQYQVYWGSDFSTEGFFQVSEITKKIVSNYTVLNKLSYQKGKITGKITEEVLYKGKAIINTKDKTFQTGEKSYLKVQLPKGITPIFSLGGVKKVFQLPEGVVEHTFLLPQGKKKNDSFDYTLKLQTNEKLSFVPTSKMVYYTTEESGNGACEAALLYTSIKKEVTIPIDDLLLHPIQLTVVNDTFTHTTTTHTTVLGNILTNDSYNTQSITTASVTISTTTASANAPYIATSTGEVVLPANTSAGIYTLTYSLCAKVAPYNYSGLATVTVVVNPSPIQLTVVNDTFTHTTTTHSTVLGNILTNDSYNTQSITTASVTISTTTASTNVPYIATATGEVFLPAHTPAGTYTLTYSLCAKVAPYNCSGLATVTVIVSPSPIKLQTTDDTFSHTTTTQNIVLGNILTNDSYNTQSITTASVTISTTTASANTPYIATSTGEVVLPANTSAGIYTLTYSLCAKVAPYNCSGLATVTVVVNPSPIQLTVVNDTFTHTTTTHTTVLGNILTNDSYNTQSITTASVTISTTTASANTPYIATSTGEVVLPANTSAGIYTLTYSLCAKVAPYNCSGLATVTVIVSKPLVIARDDTYTVTVGTTTITESIYHNDSIGEQTANTSLVNFQAIGGNKDRNNFYILSVNLAGNILIPQGTPTGTYTLQYRICDMNDIHNCATATITVVITEIPILPVVARDDTYTVTIGTTTITESIYHNDSIGEQTANTSLVNFQAIGGSKDSNNFYILSVSLAGNVLIPQATPIGTYTLEYRICDVHHRSNCDSATVRVSVIHPSTPPPTLVVTPDTFTYTGNTIVGNILDNDTINDNPIELPDDDINIEAEEPTDKEPYIDTTTGDVLVPTHTPAGTYTLNYELCIENLTICDATTVEVIVPDVLTPTTPTPPIPPIPQDDNPATSLTPYNGISLNGDNKNDYFHIGGIEKYPENIVRIYNKNGLKVFEVMGYDNKNQSFKGFTQGEVTVKKSLELPIGTYFYFIEYTDENHQKQRKIGWLYLKK